MVASIKLDGTLLRGIFQVRLNRFLALVEVKNEIQPCFLPNPGRLSELLFTGSEVLLIEVLKDQRKTSYDIIAGFHDDLLVTVDSRIPNKLMLAALISGDVKELSRYDLLKSEFKYGKSRFDFFLAAGEESCLLEVKSCTLVVNGVALFPDAVTKRGKRQIEDLLSAKRKGHRACVFFLVQRVDGEVFSLNDENDPEFSRALRRAVEQGVEVYAYSSELFENEVILRERLLVDLSPCLQS